MSWFDASGLASLAKTALKEAQKTIDKALDIKDEELLTSSTATSTSGNMIRQKSLQKETTATVSDVWGSFSGSFFDHPNTGQMKTVTTPPSSSSVPVEKFVKSPDLPHHNYYDVSTTGSSSICREATNNADSGRNSSESVEVVSPPTTPGSSLTSPGAQASCSTIQGSDSVEVIDTTPTSSNEMESPSDSIAISTSSMSDIAKFNPVDSVEIISDEIIDEEISLEEDSMSFDTVMESTIESATSLSLDIRQKSTASSIAMAAITSAPSRTSLFLSLENSVSEIINKSVPLAATHPDVLDSAAVDSRKVPNLIEEAMTEKPLNESQTQLLTDSTQSFEYIHQTSVHSSSTVERAQSPNGSDERSDIVKISCDHNSGHTSGDEVETTTSSDIEIISSPNGDSSSTNSVCKSSNNHHQLHQHQHQAKKKGHCREPSEVSTHSLQSDDSHLSSQSDTEKLLRRISELSEVLEQREYKLMELGRENAELQKRNAELIAQMDAKRKRDECMEMASVTEEYTQRMSALEKKFQQSIRERDNLREQLTAARTDHIARDALDKEVNEKNFIIQELRAEGEKLSIQILQHSNIIKKLRTKEKDCDSLIKKQKEEIEGFVDDVERLKKSLSAKEDMERTQIEAVHKLSAEKRKSDKENGQLKSQLEDVVQKLETVQRSFDAAKKELLQKQDDVHLLSRRADMVKSLESERVIIHAQNKQMLEELTNLRKKLTQIEHGNAMREQILRQENSNLMRRLEESEMRIEEQSQNITESTIPLIRQLESLQTVLNQRTSAWEAQEKDFLDKLTNTQRQLEKLQNIEQLSKEQFQMSQAKLFSAEERLSASLLKYEQTISLLQQKELDFQLKECNHKKEIDTLKSASQRLQEIINENRLHVSDLQRQIDHNLRTSGTGHGTINENKQQIYDLETRTTSVEAAESTLLKHEDEFCMEHGDHIGQNRTIDNASPTLSVGHESIADSLSSNMWPLEDIDCLSNSARPSGPGSIYGGIVSAAGAGGGSVYPLAVNSTSYLENLQAMLKQRDGENHQLQWELSRLQADRNFLMSEMSNLTMQLESLNEKIAINENVAVKLDDLQKQHTMLKQQHSEKIERIQELQMDLFDAKEVYKSQIDDLLRQLKEKS